MRKLFKCGFRLYSLYHWIGLIGLKTRLDRIRRDALSVCCERVVSSIIDSVALLEAVDFEIVDVEPLGSSMLSDVDDLIVFGFAFVVHAEDAVQFVLIHQFMQSPQQQLTKSIKLNSF